MEEDIRFESTLEEIVEELKDEEVQRQIYINTGLFMADIQKIISILELHVGKEVQA